MVIKSDTSKISVRNYKDFWKKIEGEDAEGYLLALQNEPHDKYLTISGEYPQNKPLVKFTNDYLVENEIEDAELIQIQVRNNIVYCATTVEEATSETRGIIEIPTFYLFYPYRENFYVINAWTGNSSKDSRDDLVDRALKILESMSYR